jgi:hypothetical protein
VERVFLAGFSLLYAFSPGIDVEAVLYHKIFAGTSVRSQATVILINIVYYIK